MKKKLYLIDLTDFGSETMVILGIKITIKLGGVIYQIKPENKSKRKKKTRLKDIS